VFQEPAAERDRQYTTTSLSFVQVLSAPLAS